ncbi:MAG: nucleotidyl transferase AbiEii/AbiGii toxin family protein [Bacteriovoracia bacterium]
MKMSPFYKQAEVMLRTLPFVAQEKCFALKGGTAINFFIRDLPRLSVDIDLTYLPIESREASLSGISESLNRIAVAIRKTMQTFKVQEQISSKTKLVSKLVVRAENQTVVVEPNEILRGAVQPPRIRKLAKQAQDVFGLSVTLDVLSDADLYGGKLCAALDRQHPRDLFDVKILLENEGITDAIRQCFVVYLASHDRPIHEVLQPTRKDITEVFEDYFEGMTTETVSLKDLHDVRESLVRIINKDLTDAERRFLLSIKEGTPDWALIEIDGVEKLPGIQWKLLNIKQMNKKKHKEYIEKLKKRLGL